MRIALASLMVSAMSSGAYAEPPDPPQYEVGATASVMPAQWVGGDFAGGQVNATNGGTGMGVKLYGDKQVASHVHVGVAIPAMLSGVGPTSNEYDVGLAPRVVFDAPLSPQTGGFVAIEPGVIAAHLPGGEWWTGYQATLSVGVKVSLTDTISFIAQVVGQQTVISGSVNFPYQMDPPRDGAVKTLYFGGGAGLETHF